MKQTNVFDQNAETYDAWFEENKHLFQSELAAIKQLLPASGKSIEIGAGTGLFAVSLGVETGIEPSENMRSKAVERGMTVFAGRAEQLPLADGAYDVALMITVDCFLEDIAQAFAEAWRILSAEGCFLVAFIDRETPLGKIYVQKQQTSLFYRQARFRSAREIEECLTAVGFRVVESRQTVFSMENRWQQPRSGSGEGVFCVIKAQKILREKV